MKEPTNNSQPQFIELSVVRGDASGLVKIDKDSGEVEFADDVTYDQWCEVLRLARTIRKKAAITVAGCISWGVKKWGPKKVDDALEQMELEATLVKTAVAVTEIPVEMRFSNLDGEHYVELSKADITKPQKIRWARIASEQNLTPTQLRFSIIEGEVVDRAAARGMQTGMFTIQGLRQSFDVWARRIGGIEGVKAMELEEQIEIMEELDAICEFGMQLHDHLQQVQGSKTQATG